MQLKAIHNQPRKRLANGMPSSTNMPEENYSVKEMIAEFRRDVFERFDKVDEAQAHTNGNVSDLQIWKAYMLGGLCVITAIVIPLLVYVWQVSQDNKSNIQTLSNYNQLYGAKNN